MKKNTKKILVFLLAIVASVVYADNAYAKTCDAKHTEGCFCGEFGKKPNCVNYDGFGNECMFDLKTATYCVPKYPTKGVITCEDFHSNEEICNLVGTDSAGNKCVFDKTTNECTYANKTKVQTRPKLSCLDFNFNDKYGQYNKNAGCKDDVNKCCEAKDDYGNTCEINSAGRCAVKGKPVTCEDYHKNRDICVNATGQGGGMDVYGNKCAWDYKKDECYTSKDNDPSDRKICTDYTYDQCLSKITDTHNMVFKDDLNNVCKPNAESTDCPDDQDTCKKCEIYINQMNINMSGTISSLKGENRENPKTGGLIIKNVNYRCSDIKYVTTAWLIIRVVAPFLAILFGSLDFFKAMLASDEKKMKEARGKFPKRIIAFVLLIVLPFAIQFIFKNIGTYGSQNLCLLKCVVTNDTSRKECK